MQVFTDVALPVFDDHIGPLEAVIKAARAAGADQANASVGASRSLNYGIRLGKVESCDQSEGASLGLRVLIRGADGYQTATVSTNDLRQVDAVALAERAVAMARVAPADPYEGLAEPGQLATEAWPLDLEDPDFTLDAKQLHAWCAAMEETGLAVSGVTNSGGASAGASQGRSTLMASNGFAGSRAYTDYGVSVSLLAADAEGHMVRDYDYSSAIYAGDLRAMEEIGRRAAARALRRVGGQKIETMTDIPVVFDARIARGLLSHFLGAINGNAIALGQSFLAGRLGEKIFSDSITILDEPHLPRGHRSRPFDGEGLPMRPMNLVTNGVVNTYLLNLHAARQLKMQPTGHGSGASNVTLMPGDLPVADLIKDIKRGLFVTELSGQGVNTVTGDYSRGAGGLLIENGQLTVPVAEVTVASTLQHMFGHMIAANDLERETGIDCPTLRVDGMTLAGK